MTINLFLRSYPARPDSEKYVSLTEWHKETVFREELLAQVEKSLRQVFTADRSNRKEARLWLITNLSKIDISKEVQQKKFMLLLEKHAKNSTGIKSTDNSRTVQENEKDVLLQSIVLLCENRPRWVASLFYKDSDLISSFFENDEASIQQWFQHFARTSVGDHKLGAQAISRFAFANREDHWRYLVWSGKHSQSPVNVAARPHYFCELDVLQTIKNFLRHVPSFWYSDELWQTLRDGNFLALNPKFFAEKVLQRLESSNNHPKRGYYERRGWEDDGRDNSVWRLLEDYLLEEDLATLCLKLLHMVSDSDLLNFMEGLVPGPTRNGKQCLVGKRSRLASSGSFLATAVVGGVSWTSLDTAIMCNAYIQPVRYTRKLLEDEEHTEYAEAIRNALQIYTDKGNIESSTDSVQEFESKGFWGIRLGPFGSAEKRRELLLLESWLLRYRLLQLVNKPSAIANVMDFNGIKFMKHQKQSSGQLIGCSETEFRAEDLELPRKKQRLKGNRLMRKGRSKNARVGDEEDSDSSGGNANWTIFPFRQEDQLREDEANWHKSGLATHHVETVCATVDIPDQLADIALEEWLLRD